MPPTSDGKENIRTVGCALEKLVPDASHLEKIRHAVAVTHKATILASELLNIHLRRLLAENMDADLREFFSQNWILNAYNEVCPPAKSGTKVIPELRKTRDEWMPSFVPATGRNAGITVCCNYQSKNLATVASNNVWMHFQKHILTHVRCTFALGELEYGALTKDEKRARKLTLLQVAADLCRRPSSAYQSPPEWHRWIDDERVRLGIETALCDWGFKPLSRYIEEKPHLFVKAMYLMSLDKEERGGKAFALYPLRHTNVPRHVRFDQDALKYCIGGFGESEYRKQQRKKRKLETKEGQDMGAVDDLETEWTLPPLQAGGAVAEEIPPPPLPSETKRPRAKKRTKEEMVKEKAAVFDHVLNLRAAGVHRRKRFDYAFTTDGVCARVQMRFPPPAQEAPTTLPARGIWAIDELKRVSRLGNMHVVGVDPGKTELVNCVDMDNIRKTPVRYTRKQRYREIRKHQYDQEEKRDKTPAVVDAEKALCGFRSRTANLEAFCDYCRKRHETLDECLACYAHFNFRRRRWKKVIKEQVSMEKLYKRLEGLKTDERPLVLAYGSWGLIAGRAGAACNKGNPPCIGKGLMKKLSRRFVVSPTPEAYTSKTCCRCLGPCGPWTEVEEHLGKKIRGLRRCTQRDCSIPLNRDKNGATNIGTQFQRLMRGEGPIRQMTDEDLAFHRANLCLECE